MRDKSTFFAPLLALFASLAALPGHASGPDYRFVEAGFVEVDPDGPVLESGDGWSIGGSWGGRKLHLFASRSQIDFDLDFGAPGVVAGSEVEQTAYGIGWHGGLGRRGDVVIEGALVDVDSTQIVTVAPLAPTVLSSSDDGWVVSGGVRFMATPRIEVNGFVDRTDLDAAGDQESLRAGVIGLFARLGLGLSAAISDDSNSVSLFLRYGSGRRR